ncbi:succinylglutamate desuccinylase/aspartoacylase family protein [Nitratireductor pacificus]|uniref:succinylglutamate desuccinylase/aspartoacylase family protein n=1 Tax=Nitratireductor pacificus TaxID=1231180 RepID=UPI0012F66FB7|nr:succinylglutamate desuccinylase/aspartoacylase family protein [Nitratireductor pacificus]
MPHSHNRSAYGRINVPVVVLNGSPGPTLLCTAGVHGDEYEGQIALSRLARAIHPDRLSGRLILVPVVNPAASAAATRTSPIDGVNLARSFPGRADGSPSEQVAEGVTRLLLPLADCLVDLHSGGKTLDYLPCAFGRLPGDRPLAEKTLDLMLAFAAPHTVVMRSPEASGTMVSTALERGIPAMATELGGGGGVTPRTLAVAERGLMNVLAHLGLMERPGSKPADTRLMGVEPGGFLRAPGSGFFEPLHTLGAAVQAGEAAGFLWDLERPDRELEALAMPDDGLLVCRRVPAGCAQADVLLHLAKDVTRNELLGR